MSCYPVLVPTSSTTWYGFQKIVSFKEREHKINFIYIENNRSIFLSHCVVHLFGGSVREGNQTELRTRPNYLTFLSHPVYNRVMLVPGEQLLLVLWLVQKNFFGSGCHWSDGCWFLVWINSNKFIVSIMLG
jgi:hypothetical protein